MKIGLVQYDPVWEHKEKNMERIRHILSDFTSHPDLLIFPELTLTGFTMRSRSFAESLHDKTYTFFSNLALSIKSGIIFGMIENRQGQFYNSAVYLNKRGEIVDCYRKIHPFSFTGENRFYNAGVEPVMITLDGFKIGLTICYDLRFPELFRRYGMQNCDGIINIANWPVQRIAHWQVLLKARAIENLSYIFACNRVGNDKSNLYPGGSQIVSPTGQLLLEANDQPGLFICDVDMSQTVSVRAEFPFLQDIRLI